MNGVSSNVLQDVVPHFKVRPSTMARLPSVHFNSKLFFSSDRSQTFYKVYKPRVQPEEDAFEETHGGVWSKDLHGDQVSGLKQLPPHRGNTCPPASLQSVEETVLLWVLRHVCYPVIKNPQQVPRTPSNTKMILKHCEWPGSIRVYHRVRVSEPTRTKVHRSLLGTK